MERKAVKSSLIKKIGYDPATETLELEFNGKEGAPPKVYSYAPFTQRQWELFRSADSIGRHFLLHIKTDKKLVYKRIEEKNEKEKEEESTPPPKAA
jgi:hypothetical protein